MTLDGIVRDCAPDARLLQDTRKFGRDLRLACNAGPARDPHETGMDKDAEIRNECATDR